MKRYFPIFLLICVTLFCLGLVKGDEDLVPYKLIRIYSNKGFIHENGVISGSGTEDDPFIIEGWLIRGDGENKYGISITGTDKHFYIQNLKIEGTEQGIYLNGVTNATIKSIQIVGCEGNGIRVLKTENLHVKSNLLKWNGGTAISISHGVKHLQITDNTLSNNERGILINGSDLTEIRNNVIQGNQEGIWLTGKYTAVSNNVIQNNWKGLVIISDDSRFNSNDFLKNEYGISLKSSAKDNTFYHNNFKDNELHVLDHGTNWWDKYSEGNFWDDYSGQDRDDNGIGDTPYQIPGNSNADRYPLISPWKK